MRSMLPGLLLFATASSVAALSGGERLFVESARLNSDHTVTLPLHEGRVGQRVVWYVVTDASDGHVAKDLGVARSQKLERARASDAVQRASYGSDGLLHFEATVDFTPVRVVVPDPVLGFPPLDVAPGAIGEPGYSPLALLPDGTVLNAPHVANDSGRADKVVELDLGRREVRYELTDGFSRKDAVLYVSTDASDPVAAALENVTYAARLGAAPFAGGDGTNSARTSLAAFVDGPTGALNPERQGLNSALLGEGDPLNVLAWKPNQGRYSPLWDVHLSAWSEGTRPRRVIEFAEVEKLARKGAITAPDGSPWAPTGFIVNCPIIAEARD